jgi:hypothetical protein
MVLIFRSQLHEIAAAIILAAVRQRGCSPSSRSALGEALSVKPGHAGCELIPMVYGNKPQRRRAHGGRTTENYNYLGRNYPGLLKSAKW